MAISGSTAQTEVGHWLWRHGLACSLSRLDWALTVTREVLEPTVEPFRHLQGADRRVCCLASVPANYRQTEAVRGLEYWALSDLLGHTWECPHWDPAPLELLEDGPTVVLSGSPGMQMRVSPAWPLCPRAHGLWLARG